MLLTLAESTDTRFVLDENPEPGTTLPAARAVGAVVKIA
jgi:hypothetical protein